MPKGMAYQHLDGIFVKAARHVMRLGYSFETFLVDY
jgi:hypothetical protein